MFILLRKIFFKSNIFSMYTDIFFQKEAKPEGLETMEGLDIAIWNAESRIKDKEEDVTDAFTQCKDFYTPKNLLGFGMDKLGDWALTAISSLFAKKK